MALMEDPDYAKALLRKIMILEKRGEYTQGYNMAKFAVFRFDSEFEEDENLALVPKFTELRDRLQCLIPQEKQRRAKNEKADVDNELDAFGFPSSDFLTDALSRMTDAMENDLIGKDGISTAAASSFIT